MPLPNEVEQHIRSVIAVKNDQLILEMHSERREVACELAAKRLSNSSVRVQRDIEAIKRFINKRMAAHVEIYLETLAQLKIKIDLAIEAEVVQHLETLKTSQSAAIPPGMAMTTLPSMQEMYRSHLASADAMALSSAKNRIRMARLKDAVPVLGPQSSIVSHTQNSTVTEPNGHGYVNATDNSSNTIRTDTPPPPPETPAKQGWSSSDRLAIALACLSGLVALVLYWVEKTPVWAGVTVCAMALLIIYPVHHVVRSWKLKILVIILVWALIAFFGWGIWPRSIKVVPQPVASNGPPQLEESTVLRKPEFQPAKVQSRTENGLLPSVQINVLNNAEAEIVNVGKVPIRDIQVDVSIHTVDKAFLALGKPDNSPPQVMNSNYWSSSFQVRAKTLRLGEHDQFDLKKKAPWHELPYSQGPVDSVTSENLDEIFRTFFVFRFTFRRADTGEKYACYREHGSYLKFPSQVDDKTAQSGAPSMLRFSNSLRDALIENAQQHYKDGAKEIQCET